MGQGGVLRRLLRIRQLEEEASRMAVELSVLERDRRIAELAVAGELRNQGRMEFLRRAGEADTAGRAGAWMEVEEAEHQQKQIVPRLAQAESEVSERREEYLAQRTRRRQVETLLEREDAQNREKAARRAQQLLDDWFSRRSTKSAAAMELEELLSGDNHSPGPLWSTADSKEVEKQER